ncbi:hypothetical protein U27_00637 [Candidatus Vecturithrix granuli]|uniref:Outer membrane protein beta-barrel domain-containing protein n=1 Tax=Vecturithrix granuli TaxID=1499967 RepID=A0A081C834_VECG1|nr:hypothetical protein U27_00637 [Candidatus Vecturithrix granuli]
MIKRMKRRIKFLKRILVISIVMRLFDGVSLLQAEHSLSVGFYYDTFSDDQSPQAYGHECTIPVSLEYEQQEWFFRIDTAYSRAMVRPGIISKKTLSSLTDSLCTVSYTLFQRPVNILLGLDLNFPTGKEQLSQEEKVAEAGENNDLFKVDDFGEGMNVGFHLGFVRELTDIRVGIYGGYTFYGEYDPTRDIAADDFNPGNQLVLMTAFDWQVSPQFLLDTFLAYSSFSADKINGEQIFREGDKFIVGGGLYGQYAPFSFNLNWQNAVQSKNDELVEESLETEIENSNRFEFLGSVDLGYACSPELVLHWLSDIRYYGESKRKSPSNGRPYEGKRTRYALGPGFSYIYDEHISYHGLAKYFVLNQQPHVLLEDDVTLHGINVGIGMTYTF